MKVDGVTRLGSAGMLLAGTMAIAFGASPAVAQVPDGTVLNIMRECAKIDDPTSRLACYDNNIRAGGSDGRAPVVPGQAGSVAGAGAPVRSGSGAGGFGAEDVRSPDRFLSYEQRGLGADEITARVDTVREREPGVYLVTLEGGAQWLFTDSASRSFKPPKKGDSVRISRASLGSFLMRFDEQESMRVRRVR